jgi:hypothetical protein
MGQHCHQTEKIFMLEPTNSETDCANNHPQTLFNTGSQELF